MEFTIILKQHGKYRTTQISRIIHWYTVKEKILLLEYPKRKTAGLRKVLCLQLMGSTGTYLETKAVPDVSCTKEFLRSAGHIWSPYPKTLLANQVLCDEPYTAPRECITAQKREPPAYEN